MRNEFHSPSGNPQGVVGIARGSDISLGLHSMQGSELVILMLEGNIEELVLVLHYSKALIHHWRRGNAPPPPTRDKNNPKRNTVFQIGYSLFPTSAGSGSR